TKPHRFRPRPPSLGLVLRRHPRLRQALLGATALAMAASVLSITESAEERRAAWGTTTPVVVATTDIAVGAAVDVGTAEVVEWPAALVPPGALTEVPDGQRATSPIWAGEVVDHRRLATRDLSAVAARLPAGTRAVAVPVEPGTAPPLEVGDRVDVLVALPAEAAGGGPPGFALATDAPVVEVGDTSVVVALSPDLAPKVAVALGQGAVTLALVGP
ncbi:MAG: SAF domain-containing protein, partial [Acidimicrobiales bacterium]